MNQENKNNVLRKTRNEAEELINEVLKKVPDEKKMEVARLVEGFALRETTENGKKAG